MPLNTQIIHNGEALELSWKDFHVAAMVMAAIMEEKPVEEVVVVRDKEGNIVDHDINYPEEPITVSTQESFWLCSYPAIGNTKLNEGKVVLTKPHHFRDAYDGEILRLEIGDELHAWRSCR